MGEDGARFVLYDGKEQRDLRNHLFEYAEHKDDEFKAVTTELVNAIDEQQNDGFQMWHELRWLPDETPDEGLQRWARTMVARYVEWRDAIMENPTLFAVATPLGYLVNNATDGFVVTTLRWLNDAKGKTKRGTK